MKLHIQIALALTLIAAMIPVSNAYAVTSVFQIDVTDADPNKNYNVCVVTEGYNAIKSDDCMDFGGKEFGGYYAEFQFEDLLIGDPFYVSVEDLSSSQFVYKHFENTNENPQIIDISLTNLGPKQNKATQYDVEGETEGTNEFTEDEVADVTTTTTDEGDERVDGGSSSGSSSTETGDERVTNVNANPYCDKLTEEEQSEQICHDRKDYDQETGLYQCNDGSNVGDWRDCRDVSGFDYDEEDTSNEETEGNSDDEGNEEVEEEDQNCGGEPCTDDEKEDSTTDEDEDEVDEAPNEDNLFGE
jgi:hypothetical protein